MQLQFQNVPNVADKGYKMLQTLNESMPVNDAKLAKPGHRTL